MKSVSEERSCKLLTGDDVRALTELANTSLYERIRDGSFPKPLKIGRSSRWLLSEVEAWVRRLTAERDQLTRRKPTSARSA
jgi:predicted DNA-binding transcriptional regulator AlpA